MEGGSMRRSTGVVVAAAFVLAGASAVAEAQGHDTHGQGKVTARARAEIKGDGITGTAEFVETTYDTGREVSVTLAAKGLKPGLHGVHLHAIGKCEPPAFTAAGGHFDPGPAGNTDPDANHPYHMGDIPNLRVAADGSGSVHARTTRVTLSEGPLSLFDADGTAMVIHANEDQGVTGEPKSGVSGGPRLACGVVERQ
jgi:Cu-Zn family superoxide dismutase